MPQRLRRAAFAALLGHALVGQDEPSRRPPWPLGLPVSDLGSPPFPGEGGGGTELKHLDAVQLDGALVFLTWSGEVVATAEAAVARFVAAVAAQRGPQGPPAHPDRAVVRCIGFTDHDRALATIERLAAEFARRSWGIAHRLVFDGSLWRSLD